MREVYASAVRRALASLLLLSACQRDPSPPAPLPEIEKLRTEFAQPQRYAVRHGLGVEVAPLKQALDQLAVAQRAAYSARFLTQLRALPAAQPPVAPAYGIVLRLEQDQLAPIVEAARYQFLTDPRVERVAMGGLFTVLPVELSRTLAMQTKDVAAWVTFLQLARPVISRCAPVEAEHATVCLDYGGLDIFVIKLGIENDAWVPRSVVWHQLGRLAPTP